MMDSESHIRPPLSICVTSKTCHHQTFNLALRTGAGRIGYWTRRCQPFENGPSGSVDGIEPYVRFHHQGKVRDADLDVSSPPTRPLLERECSLASCIPTWEWSETEKPLQIAVFVPLRARPASGGLRYDNRRNDDNFYPHTAPAITN